MPLCSRGRRQAGRVVFALLLGGGAFFSALPAAARADEAPRVVVLGFDGADAHLTEQWMDAGELPHLAALRKTGTYFPLGTTTPPQTPVSWSSFATGMNPARNGIFDFLRRDLATYQPDFAMYTIGSKKILLGRHNNVLIAGALLVAALLVGLLAGAIARRPARGLLAGAVAGVVLGGAGFVLGKDVLPYHRPTIENTRRGVTFWEVAGEHGIPSRIFRVPATFPPRRFPNGEILAGLGVPDIRGTMGTFSFYTTAADLGRDEDTEMGGKIIEVSLVDGETDSYMYGPRNKLFDKPPDILPPVHFKVDRTADPPTVTITAAGQTKTIARGTWSDWFTLEFKFSPVITVTGIARFYFVSSEPFGLYMSPINLDPHRPVLPVSAPPALSGRIADRFGLYKTIGWGMDTWALNENRIDEATFLQDVYFTENKFREIMKGRLADPGTRLFVHVYELTDRVAHVFWRLTDPQHPAYDPVLAAKYKDAILDTYRFMDKVVGEAEEQLGPDDVLMVLSDHGFHTWRWSVNYNTWLVHHGYMTLKGSGPDSQKKLEDLFGQGQFWPNVDWSRTKAYAMGLGDIYLNVKGREAKGIVEEGPEYERIRNQLITELEAWIDPQNGEHPVRRVRKREEVYGNKIDRDLIPDLLAANSPGYRVSWQTSLGGIPAKEIQINDRKWSGDHCSLDADITKGIFFSNRKLRDPDPTILDLYPTILDYLKVPCPDSLDGHAMHEVP